MSFSWRGFCVQQRNLLERHNFDARPNVHVLNTSRSCYTTNLCISKAHIKFTWSSVYLDVGQLKWTVSALRFNIKFSNGQFFHHAKIRFKRKYMELHSLKKLKVHYSHISGRQYGLLFMLLWQILVRYNMLSKLLLELLVCPMYFLGINPLYINENSCLVQAIHTRFEKINQKHCMMKLLHTEFTYQSKQNLSKGQITVVFSFHEQW